MITVRGMSSHLLSGVLPTYEYLGRNLGVPFLHGGVGRNNEISQAAPVFLTRKHRSSGENVPLILQAEERSGCRRPLSPQKPLTGKDLLKLLVLLSRKRVWDPGAKLDIVEAVTDPLEVGFGGLLERLKKGESLNCFASRFISNVLKI